ncbi:MAG: mannose-1-phosphate guanylyltransferase/mannose-6-phosphate isomerase, partial [Magnetococcales bacterium]|nr:mannose-1-phosphate guanylyltransferase/mannose-6-phosphate isomerase [Magnetococcales bacterium]
MTVTISTTVQPVILCGGSGTRLWPLSRAGFPKQFLCLTGPDTLFQMAAVRLAAIGEHAIPVASPYIVANEEHRFLVGEQLRETGIPLGAALLEPVGRNTAPALALAALAASENGQDPILVVTPADQTIGDQAAFVSTMLQAIRAADAGMIVILGITPDHPETGYGYIRIAPQIVPEPGTPFPVAAFTEKPDLAMAEEYLAQGGHFWNAGMFVLRASVWLKALTVFRPDIAQAARLAWQTRRTDTCTFFPFIRPGREEFQAIPAESVDYAVLERCPGSDFPIGMLPLAAGWNDLGAWDAVWNVQPKDAEGNVRLGDVLSTDCRNTLVHATSRLVGVVGVENLVVIETPDAVLVA